LELPQTSSTAAALIDVIQNGRMRSKRFWVPTIHGLATVQPKRTGPEALPPPMLIESLRESIAGLYIPGGDD
jgi:hypothetical protein